MIELKAYFLHPEIPPEGRERELWQGESSDDRSLSDPLKTLASDAGLTMLRAEKTPYSRLAQAATEYAKSFGLAEQFHRAAYRAFWADGADLGDLAVLEGLSGEVGLDWDNLAPRLGAREFDRALEDQHDEGLQTGIWGVPGFVVDDSFYFTGAQTLEFFRLAVKRALSERKNGPGEGFGGRLIPGR